MKKILLSLAVIASVLTTSLNAQVYSFELDNEPYQELTGGINVYTGANWNWENYFGVDIKIPLGFNFEYKNWVSDSINLETGLNTSIEFEGVNLDTFLRLIPSYTLGLLVRKRKFFKSKSSPLSPVTYQTTGTSGNKIFKLQYKNAGVYDENITETGASLNFQVWIYEATGNIECRFGFQDITTPSSEFPVSLLDYSTLEISYMEDVPPYSHVILTGDANNPTSIYDTTINSLPLEDYMEVAPSSGVVYRFTTSPTEIKEIASKTNIRLYPNPSTKNQTISLQSNEKINHLQIQSMDGKILFDQNNIQSKTLKIPSQNWAKGVYVVQQTNTDGQSVSQKLIVE